MAANNDLLVECSTAQATSHDRHPVQRSIRINISFCRDITNSFLSVKPRFKAGLICVSEIFDLHMANRIADNVNHAITGSS
jgi:hypothetical protein